MSGHTATWLTLGEMVRANETFPHFHEWRNAEMKVVSLRLDPTGDQWVSVIEGSPRHRGNGVYDSETTDIKADWLTPISPAANSHAELVKALEEILQLSKPGQIIGLTQAIDILTDIWNASGSALATLTARKVE